MQAATVPSISKVDFDDVLDEMLLMSQFLGELPSDSSSEEFIGRTWDKEIFLNLLIRILFSAFNGAQCF